MEGEQPELRLSDDERHEALEALAEHVRTGRLELTEYDQRSQQVTAARIRSELQPAFADLPEPRPSVLHSAPGRQPGQGQRAAPVNRSETAPQVSPWRERVAATAVPIAAILSIVLFFTVAKGMIFIFVLPALAAFLAGSLTNSRRGC